MRVVWPDEFDGLEGADAGHVARHDTVEPASTADTEPSILPFPGQSRRVAENEVLNGIGPEEQSPAERARLIHRNSLCRRCQKALVSLILAQDGRRDGTGGFVPGTQSLIGFRCDCCHSEWSARSSSAEGPSLAVASITG